MRFVLVCAAFVLMSAVATAQEAAHSRSVATLESNQGGSVLGKVMEAKREIEARVEAKIGACPTAALEASISCASAAKTKAACFTAVTAPNPVSIGVCVWGQLVTTPSCALNFGNAMSVCFDSKARPASPLGTGSRSSYPSLGVNTNGSPGGGRSPFDRVNLGVDKSLPGAPDPSRGESKYDRYSLGADKSLSGTSQGSSGGGSKASNTGGGGKSGRSDGGGGKGTSSGGGGKGGNGGGAGKDGGAKR